jgi:hypothetical protein
MFMLLSVVALSLSSVCSRGDGAIQYGSFEGKLFTGGSGGFCIYDSAGGIVRSYNSGRADDGCILPNENALIANGESITEYTPDMEVVFRYSPPEQKGGGTFSCQRLANGNTVVGENASGRIVEVDPKGEVVFELQTSHQPGSHNNMRYVRKLANGNYLACHKKNGLKEYAPDGSVVWEPKGKEAAYHAIRTPQGTTIVTTLKAIKEYDEEGNAIWSCEIKDIEGLEIPGQKAFLTGLHLLPNGNIVVGTYPKGGCFEVTRNKELVWYFASGFNGLAVQKLKEDGLPLTSRPLR